VCRPRGHASSVLISSHWAELTIKPAITAVIRNVLLSPVQTEVYTYDNLKGSQHTLQRGPAIRVAAVFLNAT
jgi:hypothetical protein